MILIYLFAILTQPTDRIICDLWTRAITQEALTAACPAFVAEGLRVDVYTVDMQFVCSRPAQSLARVQEDCGLNGALDQYILRIVQPGYQELKCMVQSPNADMPTAEEIAEQCPGVGKDYVIKASGKREERAEAPSCPFAEIEPGPGLYQQPNNAAELATAESMPTLAGKLIWYGYVKVTTCEGNSGVDVHHIATPCGVAAAYSQMMAWQNQFDGAIYEAALTYHIPARLLKRIMRVESNYWMFYDTGEDGETGMMQVTDNGLDTLLRFDPWLDPVYPGRDANAQAWSRATARQYFTVESVQTINEHMPYYARLLAAFHCRAITLNPALTGADAWRQAVIDYNGTPEYLIKIEN